MTEYTPNIESDRLLQLSEEVSRIAGSLAKLSLGAGNQKRAVESHADSDQSAAAEEMVSWLINIRNVRQRFIPSDLFADPAWDILLELYRAELAHQRISVSSLCIAANVPTTTALRYIKAMVQQGMIVREPDRLDGRRVFVALSSEISTALCSYFMHVVKKPLKNIRASNCSS